MPSEGDVEPREASLSSALAVIFRGKLCDVVLRNRPVTTFEKDQVLYNGGDKDQTLFFLRSGFVKVGTITLDGHELISDFAVGLHRLMKLAGQKRSAIMCAEAVPWRCHRSLIADALTVRGIRVDDIMSMKRSQVYSLIPFARVQGHRITYPVPNRCGERFPLVRFPERLRKNRKTKV